MKEYNSPEPFQLIGTADSYTYNFSIPNLDTNKIHEIKLSVFSTYSESSLKNLNCKYGAQSGCIRGDRYLPLSFTFSNTDTGFAFVNQMEI
jgi:hypothetical protein